MKSDKRWAMGVAYFGLIALLTIGMWMADQPLEDLRSEATSLTW